MWLWGHCIQLLGWTTWFLREGRWLWKNISCELMHKTTREKSLKSLTHLSQKKRYLHGEKNITHIHTSRRKFQSVCMKELKKSCLSKVKLGTINNDCIYWLKLTTGTETSIWTNLDFVRCFPKRADYVIIAVVYRNLGQPPPPPPRI